MYDQAPKMRIRGSGFDVEDHDIILDLAANGQPILLPDKDYTIRKDDDGLILKLLGNRRFAFRLF